MLLMTCDVVSKEDADMYLTRMEESYLHFDKAAEAFVHESPTLLLEERESSSANAFSVQLDNQVSSSCSTRWRVRAWRRRESLRRPRRTIMRPP